MSVGQRALGGVDQLWAERGRSRGPVTKDRVSSMPIADGESPACDEDTFHYLLNIERKRATRSGRAFYLLLVDLKDEGRLGMRIDGVVAFKLFSGLGRCLRGTDLIGWYRADHVIGAVLAECGTEHEAEVPRLVRQRLEAILSEVLPPDLACRLRVRIRHQTGARRDVVSTRPTVQEHT